MEKGQASFQHHRPPDLRTCFSNLWVQIPKVDGGYLRLMVDT